MAAKFQGMKGPGIVKDYLKDRGFTQKQLAQLLGVTKGAVSKWLYSVGRPDVPMRYILHALTGAPPSSWLTEEELTFVNNYKSQFYSLRRRKPVRGPDIIDQVAGRL